MLPVLRSAAGGEVHIGGVIGTLADEFSLSPEERAQLLPSGRQTTFANRVHWAKSHLSKAGLLELTRRAYFRITSRGQDMLRASPTRIDLATLMQFAEYRDFRKAIVENSREEHKIQSPPEIVVLTPDEQLRTAAKQLDADLADELLQRVRAAKPAFFEAVIVRLLLAMGYGGSVTDLGGALVGGTGDNGVDGVIDQDPLGLDRIYAQAKRYADGNTVGSGAIRDFFGSLDRFKAAKGLFVTTSTFSASAQETAGFLSKRIVLIDGAQLARLMVRYGIGSRVEEIVELKRLDEAFFDPE